VCGIDPGFASNIVPVRRADPPAVPDFDPNMYYLRTDVYICGEDNLPAGCSGETNVVKSVYTILERDEDAKELAVTNEAAIRLQNMFPQNELWLRLLIQVGLNAYRLDSQALPAKWQTFNDRQLSYIQTNVLPIWDCLQSYKADVRAGNTPDVQDPAACWPAADPGALPE
jgi:hypothetical protein